MLKLVLAATLLGASTSAAFAYTSFSCSEPTAPYCAESFGSFDDQDDFDNCRRDMDSYRSEVNDFLSCLQDELSRITRDAKDSANEATDAYNRAVESFNRRAND